MYILLTGKAPYPGKESKVIMKHARKSPLIITPYKVIGVSALAVDLMKMLLILNTEDRVSARDAMMHP